MWCHHHLTYRVLFASSIIFGILRMPIFFFCLKQMLFHIFRTILDNVRCIHAYLDVYMVALENVFMVLDVYVPLKCCKGLEWWIWSIEGTKIWFLISYICCNYELRLGHFLSNCCLLWLMTIRWCLLHAKLAPCINTRVCYALRAHLD